LGAPALPALKKASLGEDPESARRAEELIARIEKRIETAQLLEPKRVHLHFVDAPVAAVLTELKRQTGYPVPLLPDPGRLADRKIPLDTGLVPFWQALDQLCRQAGLSERGAVLQRGHEVRIGIDQNGRPVRHLVADLPYRGLGDGSLTLVDARPTVRPT